MASYGHRTLRRTIEDKVPGRTTTGRESKRWAIIDGRAEFRVTFPSGHSKDVGKGTLKSIRKQLKLDRQQFEDFMDCRLTGPKYEQLMREKLAAERRSADAPRPPGPSSTPPPHRGR